MEPKKPSNIFGIELPPPGTVEALLAQPVIPKLNGHSHHAANGVVRPEELQGAIPKRPKAAKKEKDFSSFDPKQLSAYAKEIRMHFCDQKCKALGLKHYTIN